MIFKKFERENISEIKKWSEHNSIKSWIFIDDWDSYYEYANNDVNTYLFAIYESECFIGEFTAEKDNDTLNVALIINPQFHNRGFGVEALRIFQKNVQSLVGFLPKYFHAGIYDKNIASIKCFEKAGYINNGLDKDGEMCYLFHL